MKTPVVVAHHWTRRTALFALVVALVPTMVLALLYPGTAGAIVKVASRSADYGADTLTSTIDSVVTQNDRDQFGGGVMGGRASDPRDSSRVNVQVADSTPPVITYIVSPGSPDGQNGWYRSNVTIVWTVTDAESAVTDKVGCDTVTIATDQPATTYTCRATSAGGTSQTTTVAIKRDATPPLPPLIDAKNGDGSVYQAGTWTRQDVTIRFNPNGTDLSGFFTPCMGGTTINADYIGTVSGNCMDRAGNIGARSSISVKVDKTAPKTTSITQNPPSVGGWTKGDVTVTWSWTDGTGAGIDTANCTTTQTSSGEGVITLQATCKDVLGNSTTAPYTVNVDKSAPFYRLTTATSNGAPYELGAWTKSPVTVNFECFDAVSGPVTSPVIKTFADDTAGLTARAEANECVDKAGYTATSFATYGPIRIDKTPPVITVTRTPDPNAQGWNKTPVTVSFTCTDALSGVSPQSNVGGGGTFANDGVYSSVTSTGTCMDNAGNIASPASAGDVKIDKTPPNAPTAVINPPPVNGWNNTPVTVSFQANGDNLSGGVTCTAPQGLSEDTAGTPLSGSCTDAAGNASATTTVTIKIDKTKPVITGSRSPAPNGNGWNNTPVSVSFACKETGAIQSGIATNTVNGGTVSTEGTGLAVKNSGTCVDNAGNVADAVTVGGINIDMTKPNPPTGLQNPLPNGAGWNNTPVTVSFSHNGDAGTVKSGVVSCTETTLDKDTPATGTAVTGKCTDAAGNESDPSVPVNVKIDMTPPYYGTADGAMSALAGTAIATSKGLPYAAGSWTNDAVIVSFNCSDDLSGPLNTPIVKTLSGEGANQQASVTKEECMDRAGNTGASPASFGPINIDLTKPVLTIIPGTGCAEPTFSAVDALSGVATKSGKTEIRDGGYVYVATATDYAGNTATAELPFTPYRGDGSLLLSPIHEKGDNIFKLGSVIPIKFRLVDCSGRSVRNATAMLRVVYKGSSAPQGDVDDSLVGQSGNADKGNTFRYDNAAGQYIFNWQTKGLWVGEYEISVNVNGLEFRGATIYLR